MRSRILLGLSAFVLAIALGGCAAASGGAGGGSGGGPSGGSSGTSSDTPSASPQSILGTWQLVSGSDAAGALSPGDATVILKLDGDKSGGQGPCNAFGATETASTTGPISIRVGIHTDMACAEAAKNVIETRYFAALGKVSRAALADGKLTLTGGGVSLVFSRAST
jgi:heat shock protein HslJ